MPVQTDHLAEEIRDLRKELSGFRLDLAEKLGAINTNLESFKSQVGTKLSVAEWAVRLASPIIVGLIVWAFADAQRTTRLEESVVVLRDAVKARENLGGRSPLKPARPQTTRSGNSRPGSQRSQTSRELPMSRWFVAQ